MCLVGRGLVSTLAAGSLDRASHVQPKSVQCVPREVPTTPPPRPFPSASEVLGIGSSSPLRLCPWATLRIDLTFISRERWRAAACRADVPRFPYLCPRGLDRAPKLRPGSPKRGITLSTTFLPARRPLCCPRWRPTESGNARRCLRRTLPAQPHPQPTPDRRCTMTPACRPVPMPVQPPPSYPSTVDA